MHLLHSNGVLLERMFQTSIGNSWRVLKAEHAAHLVTFQNIIVAFETNAYVWGGVRLFVPAIGLPICLLVSMATARRTLNEGDVIVVRAGGAGQDAHEVAVVAEVLKQTGHSPTGEDGSDTETVITQSLQ